MRIGSDRVINVDVRIIAATNRDLKKEVENGNFRSDLYYRLNTLQIMVPPLRERKEDILLLFNEFVKDGHVRMSQKDRDMLLNYGWPGNVRELENCALYYMTLGKLPEQFQNKELMGTGETDEDIQSKISGEILEILFKKNSIGHGTGRMSVLELLRKEEYDISDVQLRSILGGLQEQGLITIGRGRQGMKLTEKGMKAIG